VPTHVQPIAPRIKEANMSNTRTNPAERRQPQEAAAQPWGPISRRAFLGMASAAVLAGCATSPAATSRTATPVGTPALAPGVILQPDERIEPENAGRVTLLGELEATTSPVRGLAWSPDGSMLALSAYQDAQVWEVKTGQRLATLRGHTGEVDGIAWSPDGTMLATASRDATVRLWDARRHTALRGLRGATTPTAMISVAWSPDGRTLASGDGNGVVQVWDASTGNELSSWNVPPVQSAPPRALALAVYGMGWSPDGQFLAANRYDNVLRVWRVQSGKSVAILQTLTGPNGLAWSADGRTLSVGTDTGAIQLWDTQTWKNTTNLLAANDAEGWTYSVPWSPDDRLLAATRQDGMVQLWNPATGQKLAGLPGSASPIWPAAWSPDGLRLATGSDQSTARLWGVR
jgi:YD repeat-containing protein